MPVIGRNYAIYFRSITRPGINTTLKWRLSKNRNDIKIKIVLIWF